MLQRYPVLLFEAFISAIDDVLRKNTMSELSITVAQAQAAARMAGEKATSAAAAQQIVQSGLTEYRELAKDVRENTVSAVRSAINLRALEGRLLGLSLDAKNAKAASVLFMDNLNLSKALIDTAAAQALSSANAAQAAATAATASETAAKASEDAALISQNAAASAEQSAQQAATNSATSATQALGSKNAAAASATTAQDAAAAAQAAQAAAEAAAAGGGGGAEAAAAAQSASDAAAAAVAALASQGAAATSATQALVAKNAAETAQQASATSATAAQTAKVAAEAAQAAAEAAAAGAGGGSGGTSTPSRPELGEIRYFTQAPAQAGWLACDGTPRLRSAYPDYAPLRPEGAWKFEDVTSQLIGEFFTSIVLPDDSVVFSSLVVGGILRSADGMATADEVMNEPFFGLFAIQPITNRLLAFNYLGKNCYYSDDNGVTWTTVVDAHPTEFIRLSGELILLFADAAFSFTSSGEWIIPIVGTNIVLKTTNGETWVEEELALIQDGQTSVSTIPLAIGSYNGSGMGSTITVYGAQTGLIEYHPSDGQMQLNLMFYPYLGRPGKVSGSLRVGAKRYDSCLSMPFLIESVGKGVGKYIHFGEASFNPELLTKVGDRLLIADCSMYSTISKLGWLSQDGKVVEVTDYIEADPLMSGFSLNLALNTVAPQINFQSNTLLAGSVGGAPKLIRVSLDPLRFNAPGLGARAGAKPYVYTDVGSVVEPNMIIDGGMA